MTYFFFAAPPEKTHREMDSKAKSKQMSYSDRAQKIGLENIK
jgi:hypothetical protein